MSIIGWQLEMGFTCHPNLFIFGRQLKKFGCWWWNLQRGHVICRNPSLRFTTKARTCEGAGQEWSLGITFHVLESVRMCEGMNPTLASELPLWKLESQWTFEFSENNCRGENPLDWRIPYIMGKFLEHRCLKWGHMTHLSN